MESSSKPIELRKLSELIERLRGPDGCPWDREQRLADLRAYLLEEAHELAAAIDAADWEEIADELGDLLFQVAFIASLAQEEREFGLADVIDRVHDKMIRRHPHVFGGEPLADAKAVRQAWEQRKQDQRSASTSILSGVAPTLPALVAAYRLTQKAAGIGFDWTSPAAVLEKVEEEIAELCQTLAAEEADCTSPVSDRTEEELGDLLFTVANLARHLDIDPERALAAANLKFRRRFAHVEQRLSGDEDAERLEHLWQEAKDLERARDR